MTKKEEPQSLFRRLTRLFRSGPVIKKKIKTADTTIVHADKTKSSGALLFQKSLSPTYATITANAYNLSERLMRYQDYQEMEYSLGGDTLIPTTNGYITLSELAKKCEENGPNYTFIVYAYDHNKKQIVPALGKQARQTCVDHAWKITFDSGKSIIASPEHRLMLRDGTYRRTEDLKPGDAMMPFYRKDLFHGSVEGTKGYSWIYTMNDKFRGWTKEHQLIAQWVAGRELTDDECVHHINFDKTDNRPENLMIMTNSDHNSYHTAINNGVKWAPENHEWIEQFKKNHASWMRDNAPTRRRDITFPRLLEIAERVGFNMSAITSALDITSNLVLERLVANGFSNFEQFANAYEYGQSSTLLENNQPGLLTRDLSVELIKKYITKSDTKQSLCVKLGCTVNVLDKFFNRRANVSWKQFRSDLGFGEESDSTTITGRPKGSTNGDLTFKQICDAYEKGLTLPRLTEKLGANKNTIISRLAQNGYKKFSEFSSQYENHKVVSVEYVGEMPLYDLTVDGYKNFATDSIISHNTPEIAAALDIYSDECCAQDDKGQILHVYSDNEKIKEVLEDLFHNTLNTEFNLRSWARNIVKYGDFFLYANVSPAYGVVSAFPVPVNEIEREEGYDHDDPFAVRYRWVSLGNRVLENWEIVHFRLLGNDMFLPYGSSVIEPARRIWRQLILIEDAMLVYRVVRAPERRVFYIDVANIPAADIPLYMEEQRKNLRSNQIVDKQSGRVDLRYNPLCFRGDTKIPLLDGRDITIKELANEWENGKRDQEVYSIDLASGGLIVPGKIIWTGTSGVTTKFVKITLDDGGIIEVTPDHKMMLRDGNPVVAKDLKVNDSLMPLHISYSACSGVDQQVCDKNTYEKLFVPSLGIKAYTHRIIAAHKYGLKIYKNGLISQQGHTVHHKNFDKLNNTSDNLELLTNSDHAKLHSILGRQNIIKYNKSEKKKARVSQCNIERNSVAAMADYNGSELHKSHNLNRKIAQENSWKNCKNQRSDAMRFKWSQECQEYVINSIRSLEKFEGLDAFLRRLGSNVEFVSLYAKLNSHLARDVKKSFHKAVVGKFITKDYLNWRSVWAANHPAALGRKLTNNVDITKSSSDGPNNHKIVSIEMIDVIDEDVFNVTIDKHHNLAIGGNNSVRGIQATKNVIGFIFAFQSVDEDYFIPVRGNETGTKIDTLAGGQNTAAVEDVAYIQKKLFAALKIPRAYLGYDEALCLGKTEQIQLLDGTTPTIAELAQRKLDGKLEDVWVWSVNEKGEPVPGHLVDAWETKKVDEIYEVTLDNGHVVRCTGNHPFMLRDGTYQRADELKEGVSLMPVYRKLSSKSEKDFQNGYEKVWCNYKQKWLYAHRVVAEQTNIQKHQSAIDEKRYVIHHVNFDKINNSPKNLLKMGRTAHVLYHSEIGNNLLSEESRDKLRVVMKTPKYRKALSDGCSKAWKNDDGSRSALVSFSNTKHKRSTVTEEQLKNIATKSTSTSEFLDNVTEQLNIGITCIYHIIQRAGHNPKAWLHTNVSQPPGCSFEEFVDYCRKYNIKSARIFRRHPRPKDLPVNFKQIRGLLLANGYPTWSSFVKKHLLFNFKVANVKKVLLETSEPVYDVTVEDYHNFGICVSNNHGDISQLIQVHNSSKATLAAEDIRFSRTIAVIQKTIIAELNKLAIIHLFAHGFSDDELQNFTLRLSNPSTIAQQQKLELWRAKFEIAGSAPEGFVNRNFVRKEIWGLNDNECRQIDEARLKDKMVDSAIESAQAADDSEAVGGDDDIFGGDDESKPVDTSGDDKQDELPPEENASEEPEEEQSSDVELLTSSDNIDDEESFDLKITNLKNVEVPVKAKNQLTRALYNRSRVRHHGASKTHMPDFNKMMSNDNRSMQDPFDNDWIKAVVSNPFGESKDVFIKPRLSSDMSSMLQKWRQKHGLSSSAKQDLLQESKNNHDEDVDIELNQQKDVFIFDKDDDE